MRALNDFLGKRYLPLIAARLCPSTVVRSGQGAESVNGFHVFLDKEGQPDLTIEGMVGSTVKCLKWDGQHYSIETTISLAEIDPAKLEIKHYFGTDDVTFSGILDFALGRLFPLPYIKIYLLRAFNAASQFVFNRRTLITKQRMDLLRVIIEQAQDGRKEVDQFSLMTVLYSIRWVHHPRHHEQITRILFYLESFVESGELKSDVRGFYLRPRALQTISEYEEQKRRHRESVGTQWAIAFLTLVIAILTLVQSGLVKLPTLLDLR